MIWGPMSWPTGVGRRIAAFSSFMLESLLSPEDRIADIGMAQSK
jgi:hypothetical protein